MGAGAGDPRPTCHPTLPCAALAPLGILARAPTRLTVTMHPLHTRALFGLAAALSAAFAILVLFSAWLCDDAYVVFRVVENAWLGHGLRWNIAERVQAYTCPLWTLLLLPLRALIGHGPTAALFGNALCAAFLVAAFWKRLREDPSRLVLLLAALCGSKAVVEFSTSGLENALGALLVALFAFSAPGEHPTRNALVSHLALAGLAVVHRLDHALLVGPAALLALLRAQRADRLPALLAGALFPLLWEGFAVLYYGDIVPNTAHAKLGVDGKRGILLDAGFAYVAHLWRHDVLTALAFLTALPGLLFGPLERRVIFASALAYASWVVWIGGDFMGGRFFVSPFVLVLAAWTIGPLPLPALARPAAATVWVGIAAALPHSGFRASPQDRWDGSKEVTGTIDERLYYYQNEGLLSPSRIRRRPGPDGRSFHVAMTGMIGVAGYEAGPTMHLLDPIGLSDPLIARMPPQDPSLFGFRPGHILRATPVGYIESLQSGRNQIPSPPLARLWDDLVLVTRAPLLSEGRFGAILRVLRWKGLEDRRPGAER